MRNVTILYPIFALALLTMLVLLAIPIARFGAAKRKEVTVADFAYGESQRVPKEVSIPNRNYMNLLELPLLFYVICIVLYITGNSTDLAATLAWSYVALRVVHSMIHLTYNNVFHRLAAFTASNIVLVVLWANSAVKIISQS